MTDMTAEQDELGIVADIIYEAGWRCIADAQHAGLQAAVPLLRQALTAPRVPEGWTERDTSLVEFALRRALNAAYSMANESAQKTSAGMYREGATVKLLNDAKDIESILAKLRAAAPAPADELATLRGRVKVLEALIASHNAEMDGLCNNKKNCGYENYKRDCPNCPTDYKIYLEYNSQTGG